MFDLSQVEKYLLNCLIGNAHLTGEGTLKNHWEEIIEEVVERGEIALIEVGKQQLLAVPKLIWQTLLKEKVKLVCKL